MIELTDEDIAVVYLLGGMRSTVAREAKVVDKKCGVHDGVAGDIDGFTGEYAFCKWNNLFPDIAASPRSGSYDCKTKTGTRIDIKTTRYKNGKLLATLKDNPDVDIYVLAIIDGKTVKFPGWISKLELCTDSNIRNLGHGDCYCMDQSELKPF